MASTHCSPPTSPTMRCSTYTPKRWAQDSQHGSRRSLDERRANQNRRCTNGRCPLSNTSSTPNLSSCLGRVHRIEGSFMLSTNIEYLGRAPLTQHGTWLVNKRVTAVASLIDILLRCMTKAEKSRSLEKHCIVQRRSMTISCFDF